MKKGAIELSVGTIVVLVIAMTMLILGIILVQNIFGSAVKSVDLIDQGVQKKINELFSDTSKKLVVNLPDNKVSIKKGEDFGVAFGIRNTDEGAGESTSFKYTITASSVETGCRLTLAQANSFLRIGAQDTISLAPGDEPTILIVRIQPSDAAPLCLVRYKIEVKRANNEPYATELFDVNIIGR